MAVEDIDWAGLDYQKTVICYLRRGDEVLLIHKKTGLGKGKILGPGGKLEVGETFLEAVIREVEEEVSLKLDPASLKEMGDLYFYEAGKYTIWNKVYIADAPAEQEPVESVEADPFWNSIWTLPLDAMWRDDIYWLLPTLTGSYLQGCFHMAGNEVLDCYTELASEPLKSLHLRANLREA